MQRLAALQRRRSRFAAAKVPLCSGWRLCSGRGARRRLRLCSRWRLCSGGGCSFAADGGFAAAGGIQAPRPSRANPTPTAEGGCRRGYCSTRSGSAHIAQNNANNIANVRRRSTVFAHVCESSLNIPRRVHHEARMLSANSASKSSIEQTCWEVDMLDQKT